MTRPANRTYKSGMCQVEQISPHAHKVTSVPALHSADVVAQGPGAYKVTMTSVLSRSFVDASLSRALMRAGDLVSRAAGRDMMTFTGPQRVAMGQQECPKTLGSLGTLCRQPAGVGTVWCEWHPGGKVRTDD